MTLRQGFTFRYLNLRKVWSDEASKLQTYVPSRPYPHGHQLLLSLPQIGRQILPVNRINMIIRIAMRTPSLEFHPCIEI